MTDDDDAMGAAWSYYAHHQDPLEVSEQSAFCDGFAAGLKHARRWRPLTSDPESWPEEGQLVATLTPSGLLAAHKWCCEVDVRAVEAMYLSAWLPLPLPSEGDGTLRHDASKPEQLTCAEFDEQVALLRSSIDRLAEYVEREFEKLKGQAAAQEALAASKAKDED